MSQQKWAMKYQNKQPKDKVRQLKSENPACTSAYTIFLLLLMDQYLPLVSICT